MESRCIECGAVLERGRECREYLHELLAVESQVPGAGGGEPHFFAVASYNLQHPSGFVPTALIGLRHSVADVLAGRAAIADVLRRTRLTTNGSTRVRRRADEPPSDSERKLLRDWPTTWKITVRDVCTVSPEGYAEAVRAWATAVSAALDQT